MIYTSGTTGPPKGVMLSHLQHRCGRSRACTQASAARRPRRQAAGLVPADGAHRRAHDEPLPCRRSSATRSPPVPSRARSRPTSARCGPTSSSACPACGRRSTPASWRRWAPTPTKAKQFDEAVEAAKPISVARAWGTATDEQDATWEFLDEVAFDPVRALLGLDQCEFAITGAAPIPAEMLELVPRHRRAAGRDLRHVRERGPDDVAPRARSSPARSARPSRAARCSWPTTARSSAAAATSSSATSTTREDGRGARRRRLAALRRHRRDRRRRLLHDRRPQEGADHHRRRQEHQPGQPRGRAEDDPARSARPAPSATSGPFVVGARRARPRGRAGVGQGARHRLTRRWPSWPSNPEVVAEVEAGVAEVDEAVQQRRAGEEGEDPRRGVAARLARCSRPPRSSSAAASTPSTPRRSRRCTTSNRWRGRSTTRHHRRL